MKLELFKWKDSFNNKECNYISAFEICMPAIVTKLFFKPCELMHANTFLLFRYINCKEYGENENFFQ